MEKVILTKEQADAIEMIRGDTNKGLTTGNIRAQLKKQWKSNPYKTLNELTTEQFLNAIFGDYEVENTYEVGDWVVHENIGGGSCSIIAKITEIVGNDKLYGNWTYVDEGKSVAYGTTFSNAEECRHATPEEIEEEKQRRWWKNHHRDVWELKEGDCLISKHDRHSCRVKFVEAVNENSVLLVDGNEDEFYEDHHALSIMKYRYKVFCFADDRKDL